VFSTKIKKWQLELLFHGILHLKKPLVGLFAFFILVLNKGGQLKESPSMISMGATFVAGGGAIRDKGLAVAPLVV